MKGYIKAGSLVGQDFSYFKWDKSDIIFSIDHIGCSKYKCVAPGYGVLGGTGKDYGNGAIYTSGNNIDFIYEPLEDSIYYAY